MINPRLISIADYTYDLPSERIAQFPLDFRDKSKLLRYSNKVIDTHSFRELPDLLPAKSLIVLNNTRVIKARLLFKNSTGGQIELFLLEPLNQTMEEGLENRKRTVWKVMVGGMKKWKEEEINLKNTHINLTARKIAISDNVAEVEFSWTPAHINFETVLELLGNTPLPPYMKREEQLADATRYQTTYNKTSGSVAAPTAGLHITPEVLSKLTEKGIQRCELTLHVGAGTFLPVKSDTMDGHTMHAETIEVSIEAIEQIRNQFGQSIVCVGTTSARTLESLYWIGVKILTKQIMFPTDISLNQWECYDLPQDYSSEEAFDTLINFLNKHKQTKLIGQTQIIIAPGYTFRVLTALMTNFHQPNSTLLLLVAAFIGHDWKKIYDYALQNDYRFLSYGDSSLLIP